LDREARDMLLTALQIVQWAPLVVGWHFSRFTGLHPDKQQVFLETCLESNQVLRAIAASWIQIVHAVYWMEPVTWPHAGYTGPTSQPSSLPALRIAPLTI